MAYGRRIQLREGTLDQAICKFLSKPEVSGSIKDVKVDL